MENMVHVGGPEPAMPQADDHQQPTDLQQPAEPQQQPQDDERYDELNGRFEELSTKFDSLMDLMSRQQQAQPAQTPQIQPEPPAEMDFPENVETMSRPEWHKHQERYFDQKVEAKVRPLMEANESLNSAVARLSAQLDIAQTKSANPDWDDFLPEIKQVAQKYPNISASDALIMARQANPAKAAKVAEKAKQTAPPAPAKQQPAGAPQAMPGGGPAKPSKRMTMEEALQSAWNQNSPVLASILDEMDAA